MAYDRLWITLIKYIMNDCEEIGLFVSDERPNKNYFASIKGEYDYFEIHLFIYPADHPVKLREWDLVKLPL